MELSQSAGHHSAAAHTPPVGLAQAIQDAYERLAFHEERLDLAVARSRAAVRPSVTVTVTVPQNPLHHLRQILDLISQRTSECETQIRGWDKTALPLKEVLAIAQVVQRIQRQTERASAMLDHASAELPSSWRSQARLYRRMLTHLTHRLNAVCTRVEDCSLLAQRLRREELSRKAAAPAAKPAAPVIVRATPAIRNRFAVFSKMLSWLTHPLVDVQLSTPIE